MEQAYLKITGVVQGVFYRSAAQEKAISLNLTGYVKNMPDQSVEALVQGEKSAIRHFIEWAKKGPSTAKVENVKIEQQTPDQKFDSFEIMY